MAQSETEERDILLVRGDDIGSSNVHAIKGHGAGVGTLAEFALACALLLAITPGSLVAQTAADCRAISNDDARLACYDRLHGPAAAATPEDEPSALVNRERRERELQKEWFALTPHRPNYILPVTYLDNADFSPYAALGNIDEIKDTEAKYQLSVRTLVWPGMFGSKVDTWFAFTLQSYWQVYSGDISAPFRETNYEPELFVSLPVEREVLGWRLNRLSLGLNHQSNGRTEPLSRSWNRVTAHALMERGNAAMYVRSWWRIPESDSEDDNPNIERYMGQGELGGAYRWGKQTLGVVVKNNFRSDNKSGVQLDWSFPLTQHLKGYLQLYSGYGENLIDGPNDQNRIGLGLMITDWL